MFLFLMFLCQLNVYIAPRTGPKESERAISNARL